MTTCARDFAFGQHGRSISSFRPQRLSRKCAKLFGLIISINSNDDSYCPHCRKSNDKTYVHEKKSSSNNNSGEKKMLKKRKLKTGQPWSFLIKNKITIHFREALGPARRIHNIPSTSIRFYDSTTVLSEKMLRRQAEFSSQKATTQVFSRCCQQNERFERLSTHFDIWKRNKLSAWFGLFCAARAVISSFVCYSCTVLVRQNFKFSPLTRLREKSLKLSTHNFYNKNPWFIKPHCSIPVFIRDICSKQQINSVPSKFKQLRQVNFFSHLF